MMESILPVPSDLKGSFFLQELRGLGVARLSVATTSSLLEGTSVQQRTETPSAVEAAAASHLKV